MNPDNTAPEKVIQPLPADDSAANLIRQKINSLYGTEPAAVEEIQEVTQLTHRSRHQQFMYELSQSGKSLAEIQESWHSYYSSLPADEKHQVWQEFYANHGSQNRPAVNNSVPPQHAQSTHPTSLGVASVSDSEPTQLRAHIKETIARPRKAKNPHIQSLLFGLGMGSLVIVFFLFGFFNERFIAPFINPSKNVSASSIIIDPANTAVGPEAKIIIPKINVEVPVIYDEPTIDEAAIQRALEKGVVHYPTTSKPGELGNGVIFGHSANNILNQGKYKFAFVLLKRLEVGDTFYIQKDGKRYVYKVFDKKIVTPKQVEVLNQSFEGKPAIFTLITCDPPGTSLNRLVVTAEQISPDPSTNAKSSAVNQTESDPSIIPSNSPTLWSRLTNWL